MTKKNGTRLSKATVFGFTGCLLASSLLAGCTLVHPPGMPAPSGQVIRGRTVTAEMKDNLYTLAQRYGVKLNELVAVNDLAPPYRIKPGQTVFLPARAGEAPVPSAAPFGRVDRFSADGRTPVVSSSQNVTSAPLEPLAIEKTPAAPLQNAPSIPSVNRPAPQINSTDVSGFKAPGPSRTPEAVASSQSTSSQPLVASPDRSDEAPAFGWPVRGTILSAFGPKSKGQDNDGVNIAAPKGAPVTAAEGGTVVYTDNKMKGFGNLVLIRHQGGWVTAYAHLGRVMVKPDDIVAKGDMIGTIGATGGVSSPQLHFETRRDGKPVDPELVLKQ